MGSLGWARCYWCWRWELNMYIPDGLDRPLCDPCLDRSAPPWWPNELQRWELLVERLFRCQRRGDPPIPAAICDRIASFVARPWAP
jgi:hypothetical protein